MMYRDHRDRISLVDAALGLVGLAAIGLIIGLGLGLSQEVAALSAAARAAAESQYRLSRAAEYQMLLEQNARAMEQVKKYFVTDASLPQFIEELEGVATAAAVDFSLNSAVPSKAKKDASSVIALSATVEGSYAALERWVGLLGTLPQAVTVDRVELHAPTGEGGGITWSGAADFTLVSYEPGDGK